MTELFVKTSDSRLNVCSRWRGSRSSTGNIFPVNFWIICFVFSGMSFEFVTNSIKFDGIKP
jgi:hypothetical protein